MENDLARNLLGRSPRERYPSEDHPHHSRVFVADLQAVAARRGRDPEVTRTVAVLRRRSPEFAALWDTHDVAVRRTNHKTIVHPTLGVIALDCHNLLSEDGRQRLLWFTAPPGNPEAEQLELLSVIGAQDLSATEGPGPGDVMPRAVRRAAAPPTPG